jgi:hypothetical protein
MDIARAASSFSPEQLQFIGALAVLGAVPFIGLVWRTAVWKTKLERDVDNLGAILGTEKGLALLKKRKTKNGGLE